MLTQQPRDLEMLLHCDIAILPFDLETARIAATLSDLPREKSLAPGFADVMIAATARRHGLTTLSRNLRHFKPLGVAVRDPFSCYRQIDGE